jgi:hypothetical protein
MNYKRKNSHKNMNRIGSLKCFLDLKKQILQNFVNKYKTTTISFNKKQINDIIYNEKTELVAKFKEYLIYDDHTEFIKR